jgi:hypothetical protein
MHDFHSLYFSAQCSVHNLCRISGTHDFETNLFPRHGDMRDRNALRAVGMIPPDDLTVAYDPYELFYTCCNFTKQAFNAGYVEGWMYHAGGVGFVTIVTL